MQNHIRKIVAASIATSVIIGMDVTSHILRVREAELQMLNNELHTYGYTNFEASLKNARIMVAYERDRRETFNKFAQILKENHMI